MNSPVNTRTLACAAAAVALIALPFAYRDPSHLHILVLILIWSFAYTSWSMMGRFGLVSLGHGGFMGVGDKLFAVPWAALKLDTVNKRFVLDVDKQRLEAAPGFDKSHWPDMADPEWTAKIHTYYGTKPDQFGPML